MELKSARLGVLRCCIPLAACAVVLGCDRPPQPTEPEPGLGLSERAEALVAQAERGGADMASARLSPAGGSSAHGTVEFRPGGNGALEIEASVAGVAPGTYGIHIHEFGDCSARDASSAGDHFSPDDDPHGGPYDPANARHAGDLGNITVGASGEGSKDLSIPELELDGEYGVIGRAVVVHGGEDDLESQPDGNAGDPIACGVIERGGTRQG